MLFHAVKLRKDTGNSMAYKQKAAVIAAVASLAVAAPASAGVIFFDSFEQPDTANWQVFQSGVGDNGDWTSIAGSGIEIQDESIGITDAYHGRQYVELDSDTSRGGKNRSTNSMMVANIDFAAGQTYEFSFAYKPRTNRADDNGIRLYALGLDGLKVTVDDLLFEVNETRSNLSDWFVYTVVYTAQQGINAIGFQAFGRDNSLGGFIDAVQVSEVPIPGAVLLMLTGLGLGGLVSRKRKPVAA